ncbi:MAG: hypothetical protein JKY04_05405 [Sneathiella sp.]|nr:hypothetical protein [Sneathiella sp.]
MNNCAAVTEIDGHPARDNAVRAIVLPSGGGVLDVAGDARYDFEVLT